MHKAIVVGVKRARLDANLTIMAVAVKAKASNSTVDFIERGTPVKVSTAQRVAKALRLPADAVVVVEPGSAG